MRIAKAVGSKVIVLATLTSAATAMAAQTATAHVDELLSRPLALVVALALVGLLPFAFMALTAFVKISTVLSIAKSAIGAQGIPSNAVVMALGAALTLVVMAPVGTKIADRITPILGSDAPLSAERVGGAVTAIREPLREFLLQNSSESELKRFYDLSRQVRKEAERDQVQHSDFGVIVPAFLISELGKAFSLGFAIFLPFLILDLVIGNVLLALGMQTLSVSQVSLPFKLLLFVAADGWGLLAQTLISGYHVG